MYRFWPVGGPAGPGLGPECGFAGFRTERQTGELDEPEAFSDLAEGPERFVQVVDGVGG